MDAREIAALYYEAWARKAGDFSDVPLAETLQFTGPTMSVDGSAEFRTMASEFGPALTRFDVRHQFVDRGRVCSIVDWELAFLPGVISAAELLEVENGEIVRGELIYDGEELRRAMSAQVEAA